MKYTIPYDDKITLPHIKEIICININTDQLTYDTKELTGEVVITGEYHLDNNEDVMEFVHDIPISFLIDDKDVNPIIEVNNFKYELVPGRGIEIMFELDISLNEIEVEAVENEVKKEVIEARKEEKGKSQKKKNTKKVKIEEEENNSTNDAKAFARQIDESLDEELKKRKHQAEVNDENDEEIAEVLKDEVNENMKTKNKKQKDSKKHGEKIEEKLDEQLDEVVEKRDDEEIIPLSDDEEKLVELLQEDLDIDDDDLIDEDDELDELLDDDDESEEIIEEIDEDIEEFTATYSSILSNFDTAFIGRENDKYTTYKILLLDEHDNVDEVLEARNLSKALVCNEYKFEERKVILKIEND